ncbi:MAG TPA: hypothetical protein VKR58_14365, partial [Aquella sp.]|nr:hypothetical protein [Aquella sp.]
KPEVAFLNLSVEDFEEKTPGRFFQKEKVELGEGFKQFIVIHCPSNESPIHNHQDDNMLETHLLIWGSGKFVIYDKGKPIKELPLIKGKFHEIFSNIQNNPDHKYVTGAEGSVTLALEKHI